MSTETNKLLEAGTKAPGFTLPDGEGNTVTLSDFSGKKVVLYFYPKDNTPGCTRQACAFAGAFEEFKNIGVAVIGISKDSVASHKKFAEKHGLPFILLSDPELTAIQAYGVWQEKYDVPAVRRTTYEAHRCVLENISRELSDDEQPVDEEMLDDVIPTDDVNVEASAYENRIIPLYDLAVCAGNGDFIDESMGFQDFQTENGEADYALIISGESMEPTIPNGSIVLVKKVSELTNNDIAIVSTGGETMCKRYVKRGKGVFLKPDNPNPEYKEFNKKDCLTFLIRGKVVDIIKQ